MGCTQSSGRYSGSTDEVGDRYRHRAQAADVEQKPKTVHHAAPNNFKPQGYEKAHSHKPQGHEGAHSHKPQGYEAAHSHKDAEQAASKPCGCCDYMLVNKATKLLEKILVVYFHAPEKEENGGNDSTFASKIKEAKHKNQPLPKFMADQLWKLLKWRNVLTHEYETQQLPDRAAYLEALRQLMTSLRNNVPDIDQVYITGLTKLIRAYAP